MATSHLASANGGSGGGVYNSTKPFWTFNAPEIQNWVRQLTPGVPNTGGMIFPKRTATATSTDNNATSTTDAQQAADREEFRTKQIAGSALLQNLIRALTSASSHGKGGGGGGGGEPNPKRPKIETDNGNGNKNGDAYRILDPSFAKSGGVASTELSPGAILSRMTLGGLVNGLAGVEGGVVDTLTCIPLGDLENDAVTNDEAARKERRNERMDAVVATAGNLPLREVIKMGRGLHRSIAAR